jgi:intracellular multiplication protein IcmC
MLKRIIAISIMLSPSVACAAFVEHDLQDIMSRLQAVLNPFMNLLLVVSYISGLVFILRGLLMLKTFAMPITQASKPGEIAGPLIFLLVGTALIYIPSSTDVLTSTLFGSSTKSIFGGSAFADLYASGKASDQIMGYAPVSVEGQWAAMIDTIVLFMEFIGFIAFMRGWFIIAHAGQPGGQPGSISKGIIHIIGGILAINFLPLVKILSNTINGV